MKRQNLLRTSLVMVMTLLISCSSSTELDRELEQSKPKHQMAGKQLFSLFDSFGSFGIWQQYLSELTGCIFNQELNYNEYLPISYGGSSTLYGVCCGQQRALNLAKLQEEHTIDYLLVENVNDLNYMVSDEIVGGQIEDSKWMLQQVVDITPTQELHSADEAQLYWKNHFAEIVNSIDTRTTGTLVHIPYQAKHGGYRLSIRNTPTQDGMIYLYVGGVKFGITIKRDMSIDDVVRQILEYNYGSGWKDIRVSENEIVIAYSGSSPLGVSIDTGHTGLKVDITPSAAYTTQNMFYVGTDTEQWDDTHAWKAWISLYSQYKGLFEYLLEEFPKTKIYLFIPTYYYGAGEAKSRLLFDFQREVATHYGIPILDMTDYCGIDACNYTQYYNEGDVHPKDAGYRLWAEAICRLLDDTVEQ